MQFLKPIWNVRGCKFNIRNKTFYICNKL